MTTTNKKEFKINDHVFFIKQKVKAVVKGHDTKVNKILISYFPHGKDKRISKLVDPKYLTPWKTSEERTKHNVTSKGKNKTYKNKDNRYFLAVKDFHETFKCGLSTTPTTMSPELALKRMSWDLEESVEMLHASSSTKDEFIKLYDQLAVNGYQSFVKLLNVPFPDNKLLAQADAIGDKLYYNQGDFNLLGVKPDGVFDAIQKSNMAKLWHDNLPRFRESDGKIIKPEDWKEPTEDIKLEVERQIKESA